MPDSSHDLTRFVLRPSAEERAGTEILFHTKYATDLTEQRAREVGYTVVYHASILKHLRGLGLNVTVGSDPEMLFGDMAFDFLWFTQIEGDFDGHEVLIPCLAGFRGAAFLGPPGPMRALSEDKVVGKALAASIGVEVARHHVINPLHRDMADFSLPGRWVLKPRTGVMSEGVTLVEGQAGWRAALAAAAHHRHGGRDFIAEEFTPGLNLTVPVVEGLPLQALPVFIEQGEAGDNILTEAGKEGLGGVYRSEPYDGPGAAEASDAAARLAAAMSPFDYARFDFRFDPDQGRLVFLEVNMNCAMGPLAVVTKAAALCGVDHQSLVGHIFTHSLRRQRMSC